MKKFTLGLVCSGEDYVIMSVVSLYSVYQSISKSYPFEKVIEEIIVVTDEPNNALISFANSLHRHVRVISPSSWHKTRFPPYKGSFATYFKFDLLFNLPTNKSMIYIDSDAFIVKNLDLNFIVNRIDNSSTKDSILMVPSHRPTIEKFGFINKSNPYNYFNAGFMIITLRNKFSLKKLQNHLSYYPEQLSLITMGDQDLINSYFRNVIEPIPLRYNVSTGMVKKSNFTRGYLNYLVAAELQQGVVAHASGGILYSKKYYPFRTVILNIAKDGMSEKAFDDDHRLIFQKFLSKINTNSGFGINTLRQFLGLTPECWPDLYVENYYWKRIARIMLNNLKRF